MVTTISTAINHFLDIVKLSRSEHTYLAYKNALNNLQLTLKDHSIDPVNSDVKSLNEEIVSWFAQDLKIYAPTTEQLYITGLKGFLEYLVAEELTELNLSKIKLLIRQRTRKPGKRLPQFPSASIERIIDSILTLSIDRIEDNDNKLRALRDKAFILLLADSGLRVHEACNLKRGDVDWNEGKAIIIGKGNRQAIVRFSQRSQDAIKNYLHLRASIDGATKRPLGSLALFARHDKGAGKKIKSITPTTGRNIVDEYVEKTIGSEAVGTITPHSFRHYFVTKVLTATGNLKLAQSLARHQNIAVTQRYAHLSDEELDKGYWKVFEEK